MVRTNNIISCEAWRLKNFHLNYTEWKKNPRIRPNKIKHLSKHSIANRKSLTEHLICYLPMLLFSMVLIFLSFFFISYPTTPIFLTSLFTSEQQGNFLYMFPAYLFQILNWFILTLVIQVALYMALSLILTIQQNGIEELKLLQR